MQKKKLNLLETLLIVLIAVFVVGANSYAAPSGFGSNCPRSGASVSGQSDLSANSIYNNIKTQVAVMDCSDNSQSLEVCVRKNPSSRGSAAADCDIKQASVGSSVTLGAVTNPGLNHVVFRNMELSVDYYAQPTCRCVRWGPYPARQCVEERCEGNICLMMPTHHGKAPLVCKGVNNIVRGDVSHRFHSGTCRVTAPSCDGTAVSQSLFSFTGPAIQCLTDTLRQNFYDNQPGCSGTNIEMKFLARFGEFQESMRIAVRAILILYAMGFGFKMILNHQEFNLEQVVTFILKMVLVMYFSVGLGPAYYSDGVRTTENGITKWVLPMVNQAISNFAVMTFRAGGASANGLCEFDDSKYPDGYAYYGLWDRLDCKFGAYFMFKQVYGLDATTRSHYGSGVICDNFREVGTSSTAGTTQIALSHAQAREQTWGLAVMVPMLIGGSFICFWCLLYFSVILIAVVLGFISLYTVCLITLHGLIYLAPIFVPMVLFQRTKSYFDSWVNVTMSCALQPMVMACAIGFVMTMYDNVMFGNCRFIRHDYSDGVRNYSTFEMRAQSHRTGGQCTQTMGFKLLQYVLGHGGYSQGAIIFSIDYIEDELDLAGQAIILLVFSYIMRFFLDALYPLAADITGGINVVSVAFNMRSMAGKMKKKLSFSKKKDESKQTGGGGGGEGGGRGGGSTPKMG